MAGGGSAAVQTGQKSVEAHRADILAAVGPLAPRSMTLDEAPGCVLAEDVVADAPVPGFDNSAMDGYAVLAADLTTAAEDVPVTLPVLGDIPAGAGELPTVAAGSTVRIMTGAPIPPGADAVVPVEWTDGGVTTVVVTRRPAPGAHVRRAGEDLRRGDPVLGAGALLTSARIGLLAVVGRGAALVHPRPVVAVLSTGSELVDAGTPVGPGQLPDSNSLALAAAVREAGGIPRRVGRVADDPEVLAAMLTEQAAGADAIVTSGGVSVGAYDVVKQVFGGADPAGRPGASLVDGAVRFDRLAMQPGAPQGFGAVRGVPIFTLPGNPVSALVSFAVFVRPALLRMRGLTEIDPPTFDVEVGVPLRSPPGRRSYLRVVLDRRPAGLPVARPAGGQGSHQMSGLAPAAALLVVPEEMTVVEPGAVLPVLLLESAAGS